MKLELDHATVCGSDLEAMRRAFSGIGLRATYGGQHANGLTHMDLLTFADGSYLELIAPVGPEHGAAGMMVGWLERMRGNAGAGAWAVRSDDIHADANRLRAAGMEVHGPETGGRKRPDGAVLQWETAIVGPGPAGSVLPFIIQDKTERAWRVPPPEASSPIQGVARVVLGVRDIGESIALFRDAYQWQAPVFEEHPEFGRTAVFPGTPVVLAEPRDERHWLADRITRFGDSPAAFLLETADLNAAKARYSIGREEPVWGGRAAWFEEKDLHVKLGVISR